MFFYFRKQKKQVKYLPLSWIFFIFKGDKLSCSGMDYLLLTWLISHHPFYIQLKTFCKYNQWKTANKQSLQGYYKVVVCSKKERKKYANDLVGLYMQPYAQSVDMAMCTSHSLYLMIKILCFHYSYKGIILVSYASYLQEVKRLQLHESCNVGLKYQEEKSLCL